MVLNKDILCGVSYLWHDERTDTRRLQHRLRELHSIFKPFHVCVFIYVSDLQQWTHSLLLHTDV